MIIKKSLAVASGSGIVTIFLPKEKEDYENGKCVVG